MKIDLDLPCVRGYDDYHEIEEISDILNNFTTNPSPKIKAKEIGFGQRKYWAVFYIGEMPNTSKIEELVKGRIKPNNLFRTL